MRYATRAEGEGLRMLHVVKRNRSEVLRPLRA